MKAILRFFSVTVVTAATAGLGTLSAATRYVVSDNPSPASPYTNWATAARNIQQAIDVAAPDDEVVVTNGIYAIGSRAAGWYQGNRVAVTKPLMLRSVNGPEVTIIDGGGAQARSIDPNSTNRCVYLTDGATLSGFTLTNAWVDSGGGVLCLSTNAVITNCVLTGNSAWYYGGGAQNGTLLNCALIDNSAANFGGGADGSTLRNCVLAGNSAINGGGAFSATLYNCTLVGNPGGGASSSALYNCITYFNTAGGAANYDPDCTLNYCCAVPLPPAGIGNIDLDPQLASLSRISADSPCRGAGSGLYTSGTDLDGQVWASPPSIGCDELYPAIAGGPLAVTIGAAYTNVAPAYPVALTALIKGQTTASSWDFGDGTTATNQPYLTHAWATPGDYAVTLWAHSPSQAADVSATTVVHVVNSLYHVMAQSTNPVPPYNSWATAASNIQDAVDAAGVAGAMVLVGDGIYGTGGRAVFGKMTNRLAVDKPLRIESLNGPGSTVIQGQRLPVTPNGDGAVRCLYLASGASLSGFTLTNGATRNVGDYQREQAGGGVFCESLAAKVSNCVLVGNSAQSTGGGANGGTLNNCLLFGNSAQAAGGGAASATLNNCTVSLNSAQYGGGVFGGTLNNCVIYFNTPSQPGANYASCSLNYCCTTPLPDNGIGNISSDPLFVNLAEGDLRLLDNSPCIDAGNNSYVTSNTDLAGKPRIGEGTVDIGAFEFQTITSPSITAQPQSLTVAANSSFALTVVASGRLPMYYQWQRGGVDLIDGGHLLGVNMATLVLSNVLGADVGDYSVVVSNAYGTEQSQIASVQVLDPFFVSQPTYQSVRLGDSVTLQVTVAGTTPLTYTWLKNGMPLAGGLQPLLTISNFNAADVGNYDVVVTNDYGSLTGLVAKLQLDLVVADSFNPGVSGGNNPSVYCLCIQPDGKILVAGSFTTLSGQSRTNLGRLNADGTLDASFNPAIGGGDYSAVNSVVVESSGDILVGGRFTSLGGQSCSNLGRLHADGTVDTNFNPGASGTVVDFATPEVYCIALSPNGQILVGGTFSMLGGQKRLCLGRLNHDGSLDDTFSSGANYVVQSLTAQPDGRILVSGKFTTLAGNPCTNISRVNADGSYDDSFKLQVTGGGVMSITVQPDAKLLLSGTFESLNGESRSGLGRVYPDGSVDLSFHPAITGVVWSVAQQTDGRILAGGLLFPVAPCLVRLNPDGTIDGSFNPQVSGTLGPQYNPVVFCLALQDDGKLIVGGSFTKLCDESRSSLGRLLTAGDATQSLGFTSAMISWQRGGTGPEVWSTSFDYSTNGVTWSESLAGKRVANVWQVGGLALPPQAKVRAQGLVAGGYSGRSGWFVESSTGGPPRFEAVRLETAGFSLKFPSQPGFVYSVEYKDDLATGQWKLLEQRAGSGMAETVLDQGPKTVARFYRLSAGWASNQQ
jgi:uncharacterized delta-60 repeat protein